MAAVMVAFLPPTACSTPGLEPIGDGPGPPVAQSHSACHCVDCRPERDRRGRRPPEPASAVTGVAVADVDATVAAVQALGGRVLHDDDDELVTAWWASPDPDGNTYELT